MKEVDEPRLPPLIEQLGEVTSPLVADVMVQLVSDRLKPVPETAIFVPPGPSSGLTEIAATARTGCVKLVDEMETKIAVTNKSTVIVNLERRILNSKHASLWRLGLFHDI